MDRQKKKSEVGGKLKEPTVPYELFSRITFDAHVMGGQACIRGMRIPVSLVLNLFANGMKANDIMKEYPDLEPDDISEALQYAAWLAREEVHSVAK